MKLERRGKKVIVRPYKPTDYEAWKRAQGCSHLKRSNKWDSARRPDPSELTKSKFNKILKSQKKNRDKDYFYDFGIFLKDGTLVGGVSIMDISRQVFQNAYLGYRIYNIYWGKGYGSEGVQLALDIAFKDLKLHRLEAGIEPTNRRSIALARKIGLKKEGFSKARLFLRNKWLDMTLYVARSEDFGIVWKPTKEKKMVRF